MRIFRPVCQVAAPEAKYAVSDCIYLTDLRCTHISHYVCCN